MTPVDLNADLGESYGRWTLGDDDALLPLITSANVACGFHAGDPSTLRRTCRSAVAHGVRIGAQVSYPDLAADVLYQLGALDGLARAEGDRVRYLKPHGALYHAIVDHRAQAQAVVDAVLAYDPALPVLGLPGSAFLELAAAAGLTAVTEWFVDRAYTADGRLVDRREPGAVLTDLDEAADRAVAAARDGVARSFCTHGDSPHAVAMAGRVRDALLSEGVPLLPFT